MTNVTNLKSVIYMHSQNQGLVSQSYDQLRTKIEELGPGIFNFLSSKALFEECLHTVAWVMKNPPDMISLHY